MSNQISHYVLQHSVVCIVHVLIVSSLSLQSIAPHHIRNNGAKIAFFFFSKIHLIINATHGYPVVDESE